MSFWKQIMVCIKLGGSFELSQERFNSLDAISNQKNAFWECFHISNVKFILEEFKETFLKSANNKNYEPAHEKYLSHNTKSPFSMHMQLVGLYETYILD